MILLILGFTVVTGILYYSTTSLNRKAVWVTPTVLLSMLSYLYLRDGYYTNEVKIIGITVFTVYTCVYIIDTLIRRRNKKIDFVYMPYGNKVIRKYMR